MEVQHLQRLDDVDAVTAAQLFVRRLPHHGVHVDGVDGLHVRVLVHNAADGAEHMVHRLAEILAPVRRDDDKAAALRPGQLRVRIILAHGRLQRVDGGVAGDEDRLRALAFVQEIVPRARRGREVVLRNNTDRLPVKFLGIRRINIVGAQPRLHMPHGNLQVEARERGDKRGGRVAVHEHNVGAHLLQYRPDAVQDIRGDVKQRLLVLHDGKVVVRLNAERGEHLIEHLPVLPRDADDGPQTLARLELVHQRAHFDRLGARAEYQHDSFHVASPYSR